MVAKMIKEVCVENFTKVPKFIEKGADRIELNNNLAVGGTTPSFGVISQVVNYAHNRNVPVIVMIRPRGGNFVYSQSEIEIMKKDIKVCANLAVDGIALGCLKQDNQLDLENMNKLTNFANLLNLDVVMHMAFDKIAKSKQKETIDHLIKLRIKRILTHGGDLNIPIESCFSSLRDIIALAGDQIEVLPGGGISNKNITLVSKELNIKQVHGTKILGN